ncbi:MAG: RNA-splicing ligase RtcB [Bacteroidetes bacterium]|nr:RNA-splicing ligase RtcB [Bacteroidota bacterium]
MSQRDLKQVGRYQWEVPTSAREGMHVPVRILATEDLAHDLIGTEALEQALASASLPGALGHVVMMPNAHASSGSPMGSVVATAYPGGVVAPSAIGDDINCGVRLLATSTGADTVTDVEALVEALFEHIPSGETAAPPISVSRSDADLIAQSGAQWAYRRGFAEQDDLVRIEEGGRLSEATLEGLPKELKQKVPEKLGTLESGGHFVEVSVVDEIYEPASAQVMRLTEGGLVIQIHAGSATFGRAVSAHFTEVFREARGGTSDASEAAHCDHEDAHAMSYQDALQAAANVGYANRQLIAHQVREAFAAALGEEGPTLHTVYDMAHNMGRLEMHQVNGRHLRCYVHRKGAVRAFGPGTPGIASPYRALGNPVLMPGQPGRSSWVLVGTHRGMSTSFGSSTHSGARQLRDGHQNGTLGELLERNGVAFRSHRTDQLATPVAASDDPLTEVARSVRGSGIARLVARLRPLAIVHA